MRWSSALPLLVLALLVAGSAGGAVGQTTPTATPSGETVASSGVRLAVHLEPDGDARWNVSARFALDSANDTKAFEQLAEDFRNGDAGFDLAVFETAASQASVQTGRGMEIRNDERTVHQGNGTGTLSLSFTWTNFSRASGDRLLVGDVFAAESGTWLPRLTADQTLVITPPGGYTIQSTTWPVINRSLRIEGPATFDRGEPSVIYARGSSPPPPPNMNDEVVLLIVAVLSATIVGVYAWARHKGNGALDGLLGGDDGTDEPPEAVAEKPTVTDDADESVEEDEVDPALLSDEEQVLRLLEDNGGRMKQANIVKDTGWSNAKVSQLLSAMAREGQINKLRIGRENLISLPDEEFGEFE